MPASDSEAILDSTGAHESSRLLRGHEGVPKATHPTLRTPLPRAQLVAIYGIKLIVPVASTQVMPYINKMLDGFDLPGGHSVGYYSGLMTTSHTAGQFLTIYFWGRLSGSTIICYMRPT
ncbi:hypothetical protein PHLCEN_2v4983 [Hermanssonia centrifuga]|uniref:Uncharacterized protein n=1 Tax=Hermanssonia centrifuga TaxID=98765 RepID=A0A2R6PC09_9APHY|nr:hypothetical protein PHLCEN_2v4983 [Hermanssonia centrifuga]